MSTFDAGSIEAKATIDRTEFNASLDQMKADAEAFSRSAYSTRFEADTADALIKIEALQAKLKALTTGTNTVKIDTKQSQSDVDSLDKKVQSLNSTVKKSGDQSDQSFSLMRNAIEQLLPPAVTLLGGLAGLSTAAVGFGIAGIAAFKGASAEIAAGTKVGQQYVAGLGLVKSEIAEIEKVGAGAAANGFTAATEKLNADLPQLNALTETSATNLGKVASALTGALVGGLNAASPLIVKAENDFVGFADKAEQWANSNSGAKFFQDLSTDLDHVLPFLASFGTLLVHTLSAIDTVGKPMLDTLTAIGDVLDKLPVGVLATLATGYIAYRTAVLVTAPFTAATKALDSFAASELAAGAAAKAGAVGAGAGAGAGAAGAGAAEAEAGVLGKSAAGLSLVLSRAIPVVGVTVAALVGLNALASVTAPLITKPGESSTVRDVATGLSVEKNVLGDLVSGHWSFNGALAGPMNAERAANQEDTNRTQQQQSANLMFAGGSPQALNMQLGNALSKNNPNQNLVNSLSSQYVTMRDAPGNATSATIAATQSLGNLAAMQRTVTMETALYGSTSATTIATQKQYTAAINEFNNVTLPVEAKAQANLAQYNQAKAQYDQAVATHNTTAANYVQQNAAPQTAALQVTTGVGQTTGAALSNLQAYQTELGKVITSEQTWTAVKDKDVIKDPLTGQTYEMTAYDTALKQTNGDQAKAFGLLTGHSQALAIDTADQKQATQEQLNLTNALTGAATLYKITTDQVSQYATIAGISTDAVARGTVTQSDFNLVIGNVKKVLDDAGPSVTNLAAAITTFSTSEQTAADKGALIRQVLISSQGDYLNYADTIATAAAANKQLVTDFDAVKKGVIDTKTGMIDMKNAGAKPLLDDLASLQSAAGDAAQATYDYQVSIGNAKGASTDAAKVFQSETTGALVNEYKQLGLTKGTAQDLANLYLHWTPKVSTDVEAVGAGTTANILSDILTDLDTMSGTHYHANLDLSISPTIMEITNPSALSQMFGSEIKRAAAAASGSSANGNIFSFYANGGMPKENHVAQIAMPNGSVRVWAEPETKGEAYIPFAPEKRARSQAITQETARRLGGVAFFADGGTGSVPIGFSGVTSSSKSSSGGSSSSTTSSLRSLLTSILGTNLYKLSIASLSKLSDSSLSSLMTDISNEGATAIKLKIAPSSLTATIAADNKTLTGLISQRDAIATKLLAANQKLTTDKQTAATEAGNVRDATTGAFSIATSGNGYDVGISADLTNDLADAKKAAAARAKLISEHFDPKLIQQLTDAGPSGYANLEALAAQSQSYLNTIGSQYEQLYAIGQDVGNSQANIEYGSTIAADTKTVAADTASQLVVTKQIATTLLALQKIANQLADDARKHGG